MIDQLDLSVALPRDEYRKQLLQHQVRLRELCFQLYVRKVSLVVVYEGWDAAGKGGNIRRVTQHLDPRGYEVFQISAPTGEDNTHHYLWRFWRRLCPPEEKQVLIFDRSWYGRVLVERIEGYCDDAAWQRAYREINTFESELINGGMILVKFWLHISPEEQLRRFEERQNNPRKQWKMTDEDWRNRAKWPDYEVAINDMLAETSTEDAPWTLIEGNDKLHARVKALRTLVQTLEDKLDYTTVFRSK